LSKLKDKEPPPHRVTNNRNTRWDGGTYSQEKIGKKKFACLLEEALATRATTVTAPKNQKG